MTKSDWKDSKFFNTNNKPNTRQMKPGDTRHIESGIVYAMSKTGFDFLTNVIKIEYLEVSPKFQKMKGYGKKAVKEIVKNALREGYEQIRASSWSKESDKFWTKLGLDNIGSTGGKHGGSYFHGNINWMKKFVRD